MWSGHKNKFSWILNLLLLWNLEIFGVGLLMNWLRFYCFSDEEYSVSLKYNSISFWMVCLVFILFLMMMSVEIYMKQSLNVLLIVLIYLMSVSDLMVFFLFYEMIFVLIMFVILLLGYSYERLFASFLMMFYSFLFSSPVLMMVLLFDYTFMMKSWLMYYVIVNYFFFCSFMVKFPIFGFHYWLPVAHVEASTIGSMLLAGILLKMGTIGMYYMVVYLNFMVKFYWMSLGVVIVMMMIMSLSDLKMMVAYSSVAHMSLVFLVLNFGYEVGIKGAILMMFYHGFLSPLMFWLIGTLAWWKTRSLLVLKLISFSYLFVLLVFTIMILNMGFPPFMGFLSEVMMFKSILTNQLVLMILIFSVLLSCYYNIYLFWCFNNISGMIFKTSFFNIDVFLFLLWSLILNFF